MLGTTEILERHAPQPVHRQHASRREVGMDPRHPRSGLVGETFAVALEPLGFP